MQLFKQKENKKRRNVFTMNLGRLNFKGKLSFAEKLNKYFISAFDKEFTFRKDRETLVAKSNWIAYSQVEGNLRI